MKKFISFLFIFSLVWGVVEPSLASLCKMDHHKAEVKAETKSSCHNSTASSEKQSSGIEDHNGHEECVVCIFGVCDREPKLFQVDAIFSKKHKEDFNLIASLPVFTASLNISELSPRAPPTSFVYLSYYKNRQAYFSVFLN